MNVSRNTLLTNRQAALQGLLGYRLAREQLDEWVVLVRDAAGVQSVVFLARDGGAALYGASDDVADAALLSSEYLDTVVLRWNNANA